MNNRTLDSFARDRGLLRHRGPYLQDEDVLVGEMWMYLEL